MNAIWNGAITFGLVNVPVRLHSATEARDAGLHDVHTADGGRISYQRRCEICGEVVAHKHVGSAFADDEGTTVITKEDFAAIPQEKSREISVVDFVPSHQVDPILFERTYYLEPSGETTKSYVLLRTTLYKNARTAIVRFALRQKTRLAALRVRGNVIVLHTLFRPDEVREPDFPALEENVRISAKQRRLSTSLAKHYSGEFSSAQFTDEYHEQLHTLVDAKRRAIGPFEPEDAFDEADRGGAEVLNLTQALKRSVVRSRAAKRAGRHLNS